MMMSASAFRRSDESHGVRLQSEGRKYGDVLIMYFGQSGGSHKNGNGLKSSRAMRYFCSSDNQPSRGIVQ